MQEIKSAMCNANCFIMPAPKRASKKIKQFLVARADIPLG